MGLKPNVHLLHVTGVLVEIENLQRQIGVEKLQKRSFKIFFYLFSGGENRFEVDPESGVVRTRGNQPFTLDKEYEIGVSSQDVAAITPQKSPTQSLKILVGERDPQFFQTQYIASVPEDARTQYE